MEKDTGTEILVLNADGGATRDGFLMQFQADILGKKVIRPEIRETTALGAAFLAGLATGVWKDTGEIKKQHRFDTEFVPEISRTQQETLLDGWHRAVNRSLGWIQQE